MTTTVDLPQRGGAPPRLPRVVYVVSRWGAPTETFVRREAAALAERCFPVSAWSLKRPVANGHDIATTHLSGLQIVRNALRTLRRRPARSTELLWTVVRNSSRTTILARLVAASIGLAWASSQPEDDDRHLHAHFGWVSTTAAWAAARITGNQFSVVLHAFELHTHRYRDRFLSVPLREARTVFTISERDRGIVKDRFGVDATVLRMGIPPTWFEGPLGKRDDRLVVAVGSLVPKKGYPILLEALRSAPEWHCQIAGDGLSRAELEAAIETPDLRGRVELLGQCTEVQVRQLLDRAAVFCLPCVEAPNGDRDGIPVALLEAMARGAAIITTTVGGIPELVTEAGILVPPGDPDALVDALEELADPGRRARLATIARSRARDWSSHAVIEPLEVALASRRARKDANGPAIARHGRVGADPPCCTAPSRRPCGAIPQAESTQP